jgi:hypothetical protein
MEPNNEKQIAVVSPDKKWCRKMIRTIRRQCDRYHIEEYRKMEDIPTQTAGKLAAIITKFNGQTDVLWQMFIYRRRFLGGPLIVVVGQISQTQAFRLVEFGAWYIIGETDNAIDILESVIGPLRNYPSIPKIDKKHPEAKKTCRQKIKMALRVMFGWLF